MADQDLSEKEIRSLRAYRQEGTIRAYRQIGKRVNQAVGEASYGHRGLSALDKRAAGRGLQPGGTPALSRAGAALDRCRRCCC